MVGKVTGVLNKTGAPVVLRGLLDRRAVKLAAVADTKVDAEAIELRLVRERTRGGAIAGSGGIGSPPGVSWELH